jgi:hypothetical protein
MIATGPSNHRTSRCARIDIPREANRTLAVQPAGPLRERIRILQRQRGVFEDRLDRIRRQRHLMPLTVGVDHQRNDTAGNRGGHARTAQSEVTSPPIAGIAVYVPFGIVRIEPATVCPDRHEPVAGTRGQICQPRCPRDRAAVSGDRVVAAIRGLLRVEGSGYYQALPGEVMPA